MGLFEVRPPARDGSRSAPVRSRDRGSLVASLLLHGALGALVVRARGFSRVELRLDASALDFELLAGEGLAAGARGGAGGVGGVAGAESSLELHVATAPAEPRAMAGDLAGARGARGLSREGVRESVDNTVHTEPEPSFVEPSPSAAGEGPGAARGASPFLLGRPGARAGASHAPGTGPAVLTAGEVWNRSQNTGYGAGEGPGGAGGPGAGAGPGGGGAGDGRGIGARVAAGLREQLAAAAPRHVAGAMPYYRAVAEQMRLTWRPRVRREPSLLEGALGTFFTNEETYATIQQRALGPTAPNGNGRGYAAVEELNRAHPHSETLPPLLSMSSRTAATERVTSVEFDVEQDGSGRVRAISVVRRSGVTGFDRVAEESVREAVAATPAPEGGMGRGWRSRWLCQVIASRSPLLTGVPGVGGLPSTILPTVEAELDPLPGDATSFHYPGRLHVRMRVRVLRSEALP